jgi:hypothetical protein
MAGLSRPNERKGKIMKRGTKLAVGSLAMLLLGSSVALAQPYGRPPYGYGPAQPYGYPAVGPGQYACGLNLTGRFATNYIVDPATGRFVTQAEYLALYPWSQTSSWTYDCTSNLWTDPTPPPNPYYTQSQSYERDRDRR